MSRSIFNVENVLSPYPQWMRFIEHTLEKELGTDYESLKKRNPTLVHYTFPPDGCVARIDVHIDGAHFGTFFSRFNATTYSFSFSFAKAGSSVVQDLSVDANSIQYRR